MRDELLQLMLVEDDPTLADITSFRLELLGYGVATVHSGEEALNKVSEDVPDLIILDMALPGMGGTELINQLKSDVRSSEIPVLAFSSDADPDAVETAHQAGAKDYLVTPYDPAVLEQKLIRLLETAGSVR